MSARQDLEDLKKLLESRGWKRLSQALQEQADSLQKTILFSPLEGADAAFRQEYMKGQLEGRLSLEDTLLGIMETLEGDILLEEKHKDEYTS